MDLIGVCSSYVAFPAASAQLEPKLQCAFGSHGSSDGLFDGNCYSIAINPQTDDIWVSSDGALPVFNNDGKFLSRVQLGTRGWAGAVMGIAFHTNGEVFVSDSRDHHIVVFHTDGSLLRVFGENGSGDVQFNQPSALAVNRNGHLLICDTCNHRIVVVRSDGSFVCKTGSRGSADGEFDEPRGIATTAHGDTVVAAFRFSNRLSISFEMILVGVRRDC